MIAQPPPPVSPPDLVVHVVRPPRGQTPTFFIAAVGSSLEIWSRRNADGTVAFSQAVDGQRPGVALVTTKQRIDLGLKRFVRVRIKRLSTGRVRTRVHTLCEIAGFTQLFDPTDAVDGQQYGSGCGHPFSTAIVGGIPRGYAAEVPIASDLRRGRYEVTVTIDPDGRLRDADPSNNTRRAIIRVRNEPVPILAGAAATRGANNDVPEPGTVRALFALPDATGAEAVDIPDLAALPATSITTGVERRRDYLNFNSVVADVGRGDITVAARKDPALRSDQMSVVQVLDLAGTPVAKRPAGTMTFSFADGHNHWHYDALATYRLLDAKGKLRRKSGKVGFCFLPTTPVDMSLETAPWFAGLFFGGTSSACGLPFSPAALMILNSGWGDEYSQSVAGQAFDITTLPNGRYRLEITVNEDARLLETTRLNNRSSRLVIISGSRGARQVEVPPTEGVDSEAGTPGLIER